MSLESELNTKCDGRTEGWRQKGRKTKGLKMDMINSICNSHIHGAILHMHVDAN
jgi:hypothetical protein